MLGVLLLVSVTLKINAQNYLISFAGTGLATTVDSVKVENLTKGTSLTILGNDVLHLTGGTGIDNIVENDEMIQVSPNPMQGQAEISFYSKQTGSAQITIYDISGKEILQIGNRFSQGIKKFQITGLKQGMYIIFISGENYFYTSKLISLNITQSEAKIEYLGNEKNEGSFTNLKIAKATVDMAYTIGNILLFTGFSGIYSTIITDVPTESKTITFIFAVNCSSLSTVTDIDGNIYNTVKIGDQCWMRENLKTTKYRNGDSIPYNPNDTAWYTKAAYCDCNGIPSQSAIYGKMYNFFAVIDSHNLCPIGWHIPTDAEWTILTTYLGGESVAGGKLKETDTMHWFSPNTGATNETGFTGLPSGWHHWDGTFYNFGKFGQWWSSTEHNILKSNSWYRGLQYNEKTVYRNYGAKGVGGSVRCLKD